MRTNYFYLFISLFFASTISFAQISEEDQMTIDSLKNVVNGTQHDSFKLKALRIWSNLIYLSDPDLDLKLNHQINDLCEEGLQKDINTQEKNFYLFSKSGAINLIGFYFKSIGEYEKAVNYYMESLDISEKLDNKKGISMTVNSLGNLYSEKGDFAKAQFFYKQGLKIDQEIGDQEGIARSYINIGQIFTQQGNGVVAIEYFLKSLKLQEELDDKYGKGLCYVNIGEVYQNQGQSESALENYQKGLVMFDSIEYDFGSAVCYTNIGNVCKEMGDLEQAIQFQLKALKLRTELNDQTSIAHSLANLGSLYMAMSKFEQSEDHLKRSLAIRKESQEKPGMASSLTSLGLLSLKQDKATEALYYGHQSLNIAQEIGELNEVKEAAYLLWKAYKLNGQFSKALEMYELHINTKDSVQNLSNQKEILKKEFRYEYDKQHLADSLAFAQQEAMNAMKYEVELEREAKQRFVLYGGIGSLAILGLILFRGYVRKREDNKLIRSQKEEVEENKKLLEQKNEEIIDSINYAKRIQNAILPPMKEIKSALPNSFVYYQPKDIVAGDFYWMIKKGEETYIAAADCTGHGVPGAMVSVVCNSGLNRSVNEFGLNTPGKILDKTRALVVKEFEKSTEEVSDGMDIALCKINGLDIQYAGANNPLWLIRGGELTAYKADKQPIGKYPDSLAFTNHKIKAQKGDVLYLFSDGFADQFGGEKGKKYMSARFKRFLLSIHQLPMWEQQHKIKEEFEAWKGIQEQLDDICVIGIQI